jgi:hypothetical protein
MKKIILGMTALFYVSIVSSQEVNFIKSEKIDKRNWNFFTETDTNIIVKITDKKGRLNEIRRYKDLSLKEESGEWIEFNRNQTINTKRYFNNGFPYKVWEYYNDKGVIVKTLDYDFVLEYYKENESKNKQDLKIDSEKNIIVDVMPKYNGGDANLFRSDYIGKNISIEKYMYEKYAKSGTIKIQIQFVIDNEGNIVEVKALNEGRKYLEKEAVRLIKNSPKWSPAYKNGVPEKVQFRIPVIYVFP